MTIKKKAAPKTGKKTTTRKKKPALRPIQPPQIDDSNAPYPLPTQPLYQIPNYQRVNDEVSFATAKSLLKSRNFWAAASMFVLSLLTLIGSLPAIAENPIIMSITGMVFSLLWILFRITTNQPINPTINIPHPGGWFKREQKQQTPPYQMPKLP
jgi:hypothetical protein